MGILFFASRSARACMSRLFIQQNVSLLKHLWTLGKSVMQYLLFLTFLFDVITQHKTWFSNSIKIDGKTTIA